MQLAEDKTRGENLIIMREILKELDDNEKSLIKNPNFFRVIGEVKDLPS